MSREDHAEKGERQGEQGVLDLDHFEHGTEGAEGGRHRRILLGPCPGAGKAVPGAPRRPPYGCGAVAEATAPYIVTPKPTAEIARQPSQRRNGVLHASQFLAT